MVNYEAAREVGQDFKNVFCGIGRNIKRGFKNIPSLTYKLADWSGELGRSASVSRKDAFGLGLAIGVVEGCTYTMSAIGLTKGFYSRMTLEGGLIVILGGTIVGLIRGSHSLYEFHKRTNE